MILNFESLSTLLNGLYGERHGAWRAIKDVGCSSFGIVTSFSKFGILFMRRTGGDGSWEVPPFHILAVGVFEGPFIRCKIYQVDHASWSSAHKLAEGKDDGHERREESAVMHGWMLCPEITRVCRL